MKLKAIIQTLDDKQGYIVTCEDETHCKLDNSLKKDEGECSNLQLDEKALKNVLRDAGIFNVRII